MARILTYSSPARGQQVPIVAALDGLRARGHEIGRCCPFDHCCADLGDSGVGHQSCLCNGSAAIRSCTRCRVDSMVMAPAAWQARGASSFRR